MDKLAFDYVHEHIEWDEAKTRMAQWYADNGRHDEAIEEIMGAIRVVPYIENVWQFAAGLARQADRPGQAAGFLMQAYNIRPSNYTCRTLGLIETDRGNYETGAAFFEEAYRLDPMDHMSMFNASVSHAASDNFELAIAIADDLARINPSFPDLQAWRVHLQQAALPDTARETR
jgi:tetratricopeptide (TPR) repeat protein